MSDFGSAMQGMLSQIIDLATELRNVTCKDLIVTPLLKKKVSLARGFFFVQEIIQQTTDRLATLRIPPATDWKAQPVLLFTDAAKAGDAISIAVEIKRLLDEVCGNWFLASSENYAVTARVSLERAAAEFRKWDMKA